MYSLIIKNFARRCSQNLLGSRSHFSDEMERWKKFSGQSIRHERRVNSGIFNLSIISENNYMLSSGFYAFKLIVFDKTQYLCVDDGEGCSPS